jgi:type IV secretory pathway VirB10-like protein
VTKVLITFSNAVVDEGPPALEPIVRSANAATDAPLGPTPSAAEARRLSIGLLAEPGPQVTRSAVAEPNRSWQLLEPRSKEQRERKERFDSQRLAETKAQLESSDNGTRATVSALRTLYQNLSSTRTSPASTSWISLQSPLDYTEDEEQVWQNPLSVTSSYALLPVAPFSNSLSREPIALSSLPSARSLQSQSKSPSFSSPALESGFPYTSAFL